MTDNKNLAYKLRDDHEWTNIDSDKPSNAGSSRVRCLIYVAGTHGQRKENIGDQVKKFQEKSKLSWISSKLSGYSHLVSEDKRLATSYVALFFVQPIEELVLNIMVDNMLNMSTKSCLLLLTDATEPMAFHNNDIDFHLNHAQIESLVDVQIVSKNTTRISTKSQEQKLIATKSVISTCGSIKEPEVLLNTEKELASLFHNEFTEKGEFTQFEEQNSDAYDNTVFTKKFEDKTVAFTYSDAKDNREVQRWLYNVGRAPNVDHVFEQLKAKYSPKKLHAMLTSHLK